jgi:signal transduction histidine kinase
MSPEAVNLEAANPESALLARYRAHPFFADLEPDDLAWLVAHSRQIQVEVGDAVVHSGDEALEMLVYFEGVVEFRAPEDRGQSVVFFGRSPDVTGLLPYSRLERYIGTGIALERLVAAAIHKQHFPEMLYKIPALAQRLVSKLLDRTRDFTRQDEQNQRLASLGRFSAGLAHELNNPAAAARRASSSLRDGLNRLASANLDLHRFNMPLEDHELLAKLEHEALENDPEILSAIEFSESEDELIDWLEHAGLEDAFDLAPKLIELGITPKNLQALQDALPPETLPHAIARLTSSVEANRLLGEIENSMGRISELVGAIKSYSYMDSGGTQAVDINQGLKSTLTVLAHKSKAKGLRFNRQLDPELPHVQARGGQLNQVWTNLLDNAIDVLPNAGTLTITTARDGAFVRVVIEDDGPGIPKEIQSKIFEPFFTTKAVGEGTGLGLDTSQRIVREHHGTINLESKPGQTKFTVRLPINGPVNGPISPV